jgi:hypothetical protein
MPTRRRDGKASVARRFRLATRGGMARTTSRTSSSSPPASPILAPFIPTRYHPSPQRKQGKCWWHRVPRRRRDGKASVARRFRLATLGGMARTTSRTSSSSPPASPIPAPFIPTRYHPSPQRKQAKCWWHRVPRRRRDGKASVARRFRLATRGGMARTTSRTSSSSPPASPIPAPFIPTRYHPSPQRKQGKCWWHRVPRRRRDGKASVVRRFRLATRGGMARTTSRTSSSSPPASPIPAPFIPTRYHPSPQRKQGKACALSGMGREFPRLRVGLAWDGGCGPSKPAAQARESVCTQRDGSRIPSLARRACMGWRLWTIQARSASKGKRVHSAGWVANSLACASGLHGMEGSSGRRSVFCATVLPGAWGGRRPGPAACSW